MRCGNISVFLFFNFSFRKREVCRDAVYERGFWYTERERGEEVREFFFDRLERLGSGKEPSNYFDTIAQEYIYVIGPKKIETRFLYFCFIFYFEVWG
jgi:hypothetical protein